MDTITTDISLPPGPVPAERAADALRLIIDDFGWLEPTRYGATLADEKLPASEPIIEALTALYESRQRLIIEGKPAGSALLLRPDRHGQETTLGLLTWLAPANLAADAGWREKHAQQIPAVMEILESPLAVSGMSATFDQKMFREVPDPIGTRREPTVRGYSEGLAGLFWRNFFGAPFASFLEPQLEQLSEECTRRMDGGYWLVEPYPLPTDALTEEARLAEEELVQKIGVERFYDHERHTLASRTPFGPSM